MYFIRKALEEFCKFFIFVLFFPLFGNTEEKSSPALQPKTFVVFIHGTINIAELRTIKGLILFPGRKLDKQDEYYFSTKQLRYTQNHLRSAMTNTPGLVAIQHHHAPSTVPELIISLLEKSWNLAHPHNQREYYIYNWSGVLSEYEREEAGKDLYQKLSTLYHQQKAIGIEPRFYIIGFSHGGNVALNMAAQSDPSEEFNIDTLVLLATPVARKSILHAQSPFFKQIYSFISRGDWVQAFDFSTPGWAFKTSSKFRKSNRPIYEFYISLKAGKQNIHYGHGEMSSICWEKGESLRVPPLLFLPLVTDYAPLLMHQNKYREVVLVIDPDFHIRCNDYELSLTRPLYKEYLEEIIKFGNEYNIFSLIKSKKPLRP